MKKIFLVTFSFILLLIGALIGGISYKTHYAKTEIIRESSNDNQYELVIYMIGEPDWPFGATHCRFDLFEGKNRISEREFDIHDDGAIAREENFTVSWQDDSVIIKVMGDEQEDCYYQLFVDGRIDSWQEGIDLAGDKSESLTGENDESITAEDITGTEEAPYIPPQRIVVDNPSFEHFYEGEDIGRKQTIALNKLDETPNNIIDAEDWFLTNDLVRPGFPYSDGAYTYSTIGKPDNAMSDYILQIIENSTGHLIADLDFTNFVYGKIYREEDYAFIDQRIIYAKIDNDILYVSTGHNTYSESSPQTAYITAISLEDFHVVWKSDPLVCNSYSFEIVSGAIICGYGFTDEPDYLYILDANSGTVWEKYPLKTMAEYIIKKGDVLFVRGYDTNVRYEIKYLNKSMESAGKTIDEILNRFMTVADDPDKEANEYLDIYLQSTEKEYHLPGTDIYYRMSVADAAAGSRYYVLLKSRDNGKSWYVLSGSPFGDDWGGSVDFVFINEAFGFATLSHNGGDSAILYRTTDGGKTYSEVEIKNAPEADLGDGNKYYPYDYPHMPYLQGDRIILPIGQGADGDYNGGDEKYLAGFISSDAGASFDFEDYIKINE